MWKYFRHRLFSRLFTFVRRPSCSLCIKWQADKICSLFLQFVYPAVDCTTLLSPVLRRKLLNFSLIKEKINRYWDAKMQIWCLVNYHQWIIIIYVWSIRAVSRVAHLISVCHTIHPGSTILTSITAAKYHSDTLNIIEDDVFHSNLT